ncbi:MAG: general secretion pathway protein GspC [Deltaproteobacteria bacterium]|nr:general secretion pathway protein GspC [Deltaproteobacteria bacterium]
MDALLKRNFWVVVAALGAVATWFFAAGLTQLIAGKWLPLEPAALANAGGGGRSGLPALPGPTAARNLSAKSILESNPFDSVTGPIIEAPPVPVDESPVDDSGERMFSPCSSGPKLEITIVDPVKPAKSFALLSTGEGMSNKPLVREGSSVGGREVAVIVREKVYFKEGSSYCYVGMFQPPQPAAPPPTPAAPVTVDPGGMMPGKVPADIEKGIQKVDDKTFNVDRNVVDKIIENQAELMRSARIIPEQQDGKVVGIRLLNIRPETLLGKLGLQTGDMLKSINGFDMTSPEKALEAYAKLRTAPSIQVGIVRNGKPTNIDFNIK